MSHVARLVLTFTSLFLLVAAQGEEAAKALDPPALETLRARAAELEGQEGQQDRLSLVQAAIEALERKQASDDRATGFERAGAEAPGLLASLREELAVAPADVTIDAAEGASSAELEPRLKEAQAARDAAQQSVDALGREAATRNKRLEVLPDEIARIRQSITEQEERLRALPAGEESAGAQLDRLTAELAALRAEERALSAERANYEARRELLPLRRDRAQRVLRAADQRVTLWQARIAEQRQAEAQAAEREAAELRRQATQRFPVLNDIAERNQELTALRSGDKGVPAKISAARAALDRAKQLSEEIQRRFERTRQKIAVGGLSEGMGRLLRDEYEWAPSVATLQSRSDVRRRELSAAQLLQLSLQDERDGTGDVALRLQSLLASFAETEPVDPDGPLASLARELLTAQRGYQDVLIGELETLIGILGEHERRAKSLIETTRAYRRYIEERILWVPSAAGRLIPKWRDAHAALGWLTSSANWRPGLDASLVEFQDNPQWVALTTLALLFVLLTRRSVKGQLQLEAEATRSYRTDSVRLSLRAFGWTTLLALPLPLVLAAVGVFLRSPAETYPVARAVGLACAQVAWSAFLLEFARQIAQPKALGDLHFRWNASLNQRVRSLLRWFMPTWLPLEFLTIVFDSQSTPEWNDSAGRVAFLCAAVLLAVGAAQLFRRGEGARSTGLLGRSQRLGISLAILIPLVLIVLALAGYYYTALQLEDRLRESLGYGFLLLLVNALLLRGLYVARRRLAVEQARQRAIARAKSTEESQVSTPSESGTVAIDDESIDIPAVDAQTRQLIRSGIAAAALIGVFYIWSSAFPAVKFLERVHLWPRFEVVEASAVGEYAEPDAAAQQAAAQTPGAGGQTTPANGASGSAPSGVPVATTTSPSTSSVDSAAEVDATDEEPLPSVVTLADLILSLVILALMIVATKNGPSLLEIALLQHLPLDSGARYALRTLFRYVLLTVGLSAGLGALGIGWSKVQWLAAALTFGLGFGLQEIFANFVSGIIILIERPIRVGDIVTVGGTEGRVTKLRMRATTILDWDRRELLVPNREFITGSVINWTLSDPVTRVIIPVGIAYGSDTARARDLMLRAARENPHVLTDPAPSAIFRSFGASSLDFEVRVFMANRDLWPAVIDGLHSQIDALFREAEIEISFPQRDLHIRSAEGLEGLLRERGRGGEG